MRWAHAIRTRYIQEIIDAAIDNGINYFDTADLYDKGLNEINIGKALKTKREKVIIATKVGKPMAKGWQRLGLESTKRLYTCFC